MKCWSMILLGTMVVIVLACCSCTMRQTANPPDDYVDPLAKSHLPKVEPETNRAYWDNELYDMRTRKNQIP